MPISWLKRCRQIIEFLEANGFNTEVDIFTLRKAIKLNAGATERTVNTYLQLLEEFGFLIRKNNNIFLINKVGKMQI